MKLAPGFLRKIRIWLAVVGMVALIVYGFCCLIVRETSHRVPNETTGHTYVYEMHRGDRVIPVYVKPSFHWTSEVSRVLAAACLGFLTVELLATILSRSLLELLPDRFESLNSELLRYRQTAGPNGVTAEGLRYVAAWRDLKRRGALAMVLICSGFAWLLLGWAIYPAELLPPDLPVELQILPMELILLGFVAIGWAWFFRCPRCGNRYQSKARHEESTKFCTHCGLPEDSLPTTDVSPDFIEWQKQR